MKKVTMIGCGKLGLPCAEIMNEKYEVIGYDVYPQSNSKIKIIINTTIGFLNNILFGKIDITCRINQHKLQLHNGSSSSKSSFFLLY